MQPTGLTTEQKRFYEENGYILIKGLFSSEEAAAFCAEAQELIDRVRKIKNIDATWSSVRKEEEEKKTVIFVCHDVQFYAAIYTRMIYDPRLTTIMSDLIGPNVQLHHTKMFIKPPEKGSPFPMHQDYWYFPHQNQTMTAAVIHFDDAPLEKGCLRVVPGSHKLGALEPDNKGDSSLSSERYPVEGATPCPASAGDVLFFNYLTIHGSGVNVSPEARTTVLIQFRDPTDPPLWRSHESRGQGTMLAGIDPSSCATKPLAEKRPAPVKAM